jgi:hypothetical protein
LTGIFFAHKIEGVMEKWTQGVIGVWILLSPWLLGFASVSLAKWSCALCGMAFVLVNAWRLFGTKPETKSY